MSSVTVALLQLRTKAQLSASTLRERKAAALAQLQAQQQYAGVQGAGHTPSGPRRKAEGIEDEQQGVIAAEATTGGGALLRVTLLAAGYVIGPAGSSVREVSRVTGADVRSWSESWQEPSASCGSGANTAAPRRVRTIIVEGKRRSVVHALRIIAAAVDRYVDLTGGSYCGKAVDRSHVIDGCTFFYSPPPRAAVPFAASLRGHDRLASPPARKSPVAAADKENAAATVAALALPAEPPSPQCPLLQQMQALSPPPATPATGITAATFGHMQQMLLGPLRTVTQISAAAETATGGGAAAMDVDQGQEEASTPAYRTYHLFDTSSGFGAGGSLLHQEAFCGGSASLFASAYEASTPSISTASDSLFRSGSLPTPGAAAVGSSGAGGSSSLAGQPSFGFLSAPTPSLGADSLLRSPSIGEDALLAATGFPSYTTFAQQASHYQPALWPTHTAPLPPPSSALPQLQPSSLMTAGPLAQLPLGTGQGWGSLWLQQQQPL